MATEYLTFKVSQQRFCLPLLSIKEIITYREPNPLPGSLGVVEGAIFLRDELVTVIDVKTLFNIFDDKKPSHIVILDFPEGLLGLSVDSLDGTIDTSDNAVTDIKDLFKKGVKFLSGVVRDNEALYNLFSIKELHKLITPEV